MPCIHAWAVRASNWIPHAQNAMLPDTGHAMPQTNPKGSAEMLADFFARHPMSR